MKQTITLKVDLHDQRDKKAAMKIVTNFAGVDSCGIDMKTGKLTVVGDVDTADVVAKLRKRFTTHVESVGPAKDEKKGNESSKNTDSSKKPGGGIVDGNVVYVPVQGVYHPYPYPIDPQWPASDHRSEGENPSCCVIS